MIYEFSSLISFLVLSILLLGASLYYRQLRKSAPQKYGTANFQKMVARAELWDSFIRVFITLLIISRIITIFSAPGEVLRLNLPNDNFIRFLISSFLFSNVWFVFLILLILKKEIKTEHRLKYQISVILFAIFLTLVDLAFSYVLFLKGFFSIFQQHMDAAPYFTIQDIQAGNPLLIILFFLMIVQITFYLLFFIRRSLNHVYQYWVSLFIYVLVLIFYILSVGLYIVGWQESTSIRLNLFSLQYGYWGWIFLFFFSLLVISNLLGFMLLKFRPIMSNPQRARNLLSPLLKIGFIGLWGASILCLTPQALILFY